MENRTIKFNVQGDERKALACAISRILKTGVHYAGAPTFNYEVGEYVIDKTGTLSAPETVTAEDVQRLVEQLNAEDFEAVQEEPKANRTQEGEPEQAIETEPEQVAETSNTDAESDPEADRTQVGEPEQAIETEPEQVAENSNTDAESDPDADRTQVAESNDADADTNPEAGHTQDAEAENEPDCSQESETVCTQEDLEAAEPEYGYTLVLKKGDDFTPTAECNLRKIIEDKGYMIKKTLNADTLDFEVLDDEVTFPWWSKCPSPDEIQAYNSFITAIVKTAKAQSRVNSKNQQAENEKYAFRCFLLRLGFIGESFKQTRKILLKRLSGNSAFKNKTE